LWDGFKIKDLSFEEFNRQIQELTDPVRMAADLVKLRQGIRPGGTV
jgi:hypothetical protein